MKKYTFFQVVKHLAIRKLNCKFILGNRGIIFVCTVACLWGHE